MSLIADSLDTMIGTDTVAALALPRKSIFVARQLLTVTEKSVRQIEKVKIVADFPFFK